MKNTNENKRSFAEIAGKASFYRTARHIATGRYVALRGICGESFIVRLNKATKLIHWTELEAFCL